MFSGVVDGVLASCLVIVFMGIVGVLQGKGNWLAVVVIASAAYAVNVKLTGAAFVFCLFFVFSIVVWFYYRNRLKIFLQIVGASCLLSLFIGVNPYITNFFNYDRFLNLFSSYTWFAVKVQAFDKTKLQLFKEVYLNFSNYAEYFVVDGPSLIERISCRPFEPWGFGLII